jgi:hypothetical protein
MDKGSVPVELHAVSGPGSAAVDHPVGPEWPPARCGSLPSCFPAFPTVMRASTDLSIPLPWPIGSPRAPSMHAAVVPVAAACARSLRAWDGSSALSLAPRHSSVLRVYCCPHAGTAARAVAWPTVPRCLVCGVALSMSSVHRAACLCTLLGKCSHPSGRPSTPNSPHLTPA